VKRHPLDLGRDHFLHFFGWAPDDLPANVEQYGRPLPNVERAGARVTHPNLKVPGETCDSAVHFDIPEAILMRSEKDSLWTVVEWEPLALTPSLLCRLCGDHGFIRKGKWVPV